MPHVLMIKGEKRPETIFTDEQFARLLDERLGYDAAEYFRERGKNLKEEIWDEFAKDPLWYCTGECDKVYDVQEQFESKLDSVMVKLRELYAHLSKLTMEHPKKNYGLGICAEAMKRCDISFKERAANHRER